MTSPVVEDLVHGLYPLLTTLHKRCSPRFFQLACLRLYRLLAHQNSARVAVPPFLRPRVHRHQNYQGPWIEDAFERHFFSRSAPALSRTYLPLRWTDYGWRYEFKPHRELQDFLELMLQPDEKYFTVLQSAHGFQQSLPDNILVFGAGGAGDVAIPLLRGGLRYTSKASKRFKVTFQGDLATTALRAIDVRRLMYLELADRENFHFFDIGSAEDYYAVLADSEFVLCPRGFGPTSFRMYEALSLGAIPIYIWEEVEWLPCRDEIDWSELIVSVDYRRINKLPRIIEAMTPEQVLFKQRAIRRLHDDYFTLEGVCRYIERYLS